MFAFMYSVRDEGWRLVGDAIATHTNSFSEQREQEGMISPVDSIRATSLARRSEERLGGMIRREEGQQIELGDTIPLIDDLEMEDVFEDEDREEGASVTDLINGLVDLILVELADQRGAARQTFGLRDER